ncbi:MAG: site-specific integrase [Alphaproteobacteria bacterium]
MADGTITRRGKSSWRLKYDLPRDPETGKRRIVYVTVKGKRADAAAELRRRLTTLDKGIHVDPSKITVGEYIDDWLDSTAPKTVAPAALERYRSLARNQVKPHLGSIPLQKLRPADVDRWLQALGKPRQDVPKGGKAQISSRSIRAAHGVLGAALAHAAAVELVERNVARIIKPPKLVRQEMVILTDGQIGDVLERMRDHPSLYPIVALAIGTGARRGEIAGLRWSDLDLDRNTGGSMTIERSIEQTQRDGLRVKQPKTAAGRRTISLPQFAADALRQHRLEQRKLRLALGVGALPADAWVFGDHEGNLPNPYSITDRWRDAVKNRKLPKVTFHAFRHTHASALIAAGLDVVSVSRRLGHASPALTLSVYSHLFVNNDDAAARAIDAVLGPS